MDDLPAHGTGAQWMQEDGQTGGRHTCGEVAAAGSWFLSGCLTRQHLAHA